MLLEQERVGKKSRSKLLMLRDEQGNTPLIRAAHHGHLPMVLLLLEVTDPHNATLLLSVLLCVFCSLCILC
jgi:hypothetical protein